MKLDTILLEKKEKVATITMNRPQVFNAINFPMINELGKVFDDVLQDREIQSVILTGAGRGFCSGADLVNFVNVIEKNSPLENRAVMKKLGDLIMKIVNTGKPVIAAVNGVAVGGGCNLALACDIIIASDKAIFSEIFIKIGVIPDLGGLYFLPRRIGMAKTKELIFTGRMVTALEAESIGLINRVVPGDQLLTEAHTLAQELANGPPKAIEMSKTILNQATDIGLKELLEIEAQAQSLLFATRDFREGKNAFLQKRKPVFTGD